jgi:DNA repair exonuclease SbcCD ATPase subunit
MSDNNDQRQWMALVSKMLEDVSKKFDDVSDKLDTHKVMNDRNLESLSDSMMDNNKELQVKIDDSLKEIKHKLDENHEKNIKNEMKIIEIEKNLLKFEQDNKEKDQAQNKIIEKHQEDLSAVKAASIKVSGSLSVLIPIIYYIVNKFLS